MNKLLPIVAACCLGLVSHARAESSTAAVQQKLKDEGFYYGDITGTNDADTTAAIRRYQIRNGLKITGELNAETQKSLGVRGAAPSKAETPAPRNQSSAPAPKLAPVPDTSDAPGSNQIAPPRPAAAQQPPGPQPGAPQPGYAPGPRASYPAAGGVFSGTPFDAAPADVQRRVLVGVQTSLARQGYYRGAIDGEFGAGTALAVRVYQSRFHISASGRLDMATLAALGLLPGQRAPGFYPRERGAYRQPGTAPGPGERLYIPQ